MRMMLQKWSQGLAIVLACLIAVPAPAMAQGVKLIRDSEVESLMRFYANPVFRAAGLEPRAVSVHLINDNSINAFVANGQRIFIHTGLILEADTPNEVIGVLAHETGHIAGGHLARMRQHIDELQTANIVAMLLGVAAVAGGALAGGAQGGRAGAAGLLGSQSIIQRNFLSYQRTQEAAADQAAMRYLEATKQSGKGMLQLFQKLADQALISLRHVDPYVLSHPMPRDRINLLENLVSKSSYKNVKDSDALIFRHRLAQAKLRGFLEPAPQVLRRFPPGDNSAPARYARAIAYFRAGELSRALPEIDALIAAMPKNPYFHELKGQMFLESSRVAQAIAPLEKALSLSPHSGLIEIMLAQAMLASENKALIDKAIRHLIKAKTQESQSPELHRQLAIAYANKGDIAHAQLSTAEVAILAGDLKLAKTQASRAKAKFTKGTPEWIKANDILNIKSKKK